MRTSFLAAIAICLAAVVPTQAGPIFSNSGLISIPTSGSANPYPSTIAVSGLTGLASEVIVRVFGLSHTWPDDLDILLVNPTGTGILLMSDVAGGSLLSNVNVVFRDGFPVLPDSTLFVSGTYSPTNYGTGDTLSSPAPAAPYATTLAALLGANNNGNWNLYVSDDAAADSGSIAGGWSLEFVGASVAAVPEPSTAVLITVGLAVIGFLRRRR